MRQRQPAIQACPARVIFIDETSVNTKMVRLWGRAKDGARSQGAASFGHWVSQTFIAGLKCDGLIAPWVIDAAMDRAAFDTSIEHVLAPTLGKGECCHSR